MGTKKSIKVVIQLVLYCTLCFHSCEYEPTKVYQRSVDQNVLPPEIQTIELNLDNDSIYLYTDKVVNFVFNTSNQKIKAVRFLLDGNEQKIVYSNNGVFTLDYGDITEGVHTLLIEIYTEAGTGSIADKIGVEGYLFSKGWALIVNKSYYKEINATDQNGFLKITWAKYLGSDFKEYIVYRTRGWGSEIEIKRLKTAGFIDSTYVGEGGEYIIKVNTLNETLIWWSRLDLQQDLPEVKFTATENNQYSFHWNRSRFYNAVDTFEIYQNIGNYGKYTRVKSTQNPDDTIFFTTALFGDDVTVNLKLVPKNKIILYTPPYYYLYESSLNVNMGFSFLDSYKSITDIHQVNNDEFIYVQYYDSLIKYSISKKRITEKIGFHATGCSTGEFYSLKTSPSGKYLTTYVGCNDDVLWTNSNNLSNYSLRNLKYLTGQQYVPSIPISDIGTGIIHGTGEGFYLYDFNSSVTLAHYKKDFYGGRGLTISPSGEYLFIIDDSLRLFQFKDGDFKNIWSQSQFINIKFYEFNALDPSQLVYWDGNKFSVKQCNNFSNVYEFSLTDMNIFNIDYYNKEILSYSTGHLYIRSLTDGSLLKDIPINIDPTYYWQKCYLINHSIVCIKKIIYFVN